MKNMHKLCALLSVLCVCGCTAKTEVLSKAESAEIVTAQLSDTDFESAAKSMLDDMLTEELAGNKKYLMEVAEIKNDTMQRINTADLTDYIRRELRRSGKVTLTNLNENASIAASRKLNDSAIMNKSTTMKNGTVSAANTSLFGRISQRDLRVDGGKKKIEYIFSLSLTDLRDGTEIWSDKEVITKITDKKTKTW
jgi:uncharacterized protein (TIGR02722 family)